MKTIEELSIEDLNDIVEEKPVSIIIWDEEVILSGGIYFYKDNRQMAPFLDKIKELLSCFDKSKTEIVQSVSDEFLCLAQEWRKENDMQETISGDSFRDSIEIVEIGFCIGNVDDEPDIQVYLGCDDYFSDHVICCYLLKDNDKIQYKFSLEG